MTEATILTYTNFILPSSVVTKADVSHLVTELENIDNALTAATVRAKAGAPAQASPTLSQQLTEFLTQNKLTIGKGPQRSELVKQMQLLKDHAPVVSMTFAVPADRESLGQLVYWLRTSVHRQALIAAGLQPGLVAGVYLRTPNHVYDMSMRAKLAVSHGVLVKELEALRARR